MNIRTAYRIQAFAAALFIAVSVWLFFAASDMPTQNVTENRLAVYRGTLGLLAAGCLAAMIGRDRIRFNAVDLSVALLAAIVAVETWLHGDIGPKHDEYAISLILYIALRLAFQGSHTLKSAALVAVFAVATYQGLIGIGQALGVNMSNHGLFHITGTLFNPGPYAGLMSVAGVCAASHLAMQYGKIKSLSSRRRTDMKVLIEIPAYLLAIPTAVVCIIILPATLSRASWIAAIVATAALSLKEFSAIDFLRRFLIRRRLCGIAMLSVTIAAILCAGAWAYSVKPDSAYGRMLIWKIDARIMLRNPWGVGTGKFAGAFGREQAAYFSEKERPAEDKSAAGCPETGFNEYLQFGAETGLIGFLIFTSIILAAVCIGLSHRDATGYGLTAMAAFAMLSYPLDVPPLRILFIFLLASSVSHPPIANSRRRKAIHKTAYPTIAVISALAATLLCARSREYVSAHKQWQRTRIWLSTEHYDYLVEDGKKLYDVLKHDYRFLYDYGYSLHKSGNYAESIRVLQRGTLFSGDPMFFNIIGKNYQAQGQWEMAEANYRHASDMIPSRIYPLYLAAKLHIESGRYDKAVSTAREALRMPLKIESEQTAELKRELRAIVDEYAEK